jgi:HTH-type transcriptional regulator/antitoxin HigA
MNIVADNIDGAVLEAAWLEFDRVTRLRPITSEAEYDHTVALMNRVLDMMGENEQHALAGLLELLAAMVTDYDKLHYRVAEL